MQRFKILMLIGFCDFFNATLVLEGPSVNLDQLDLSTFYILFLVCFILWFFHDSFL